MSFYKDSILRQNFFDALFWILNAQLNSVENLERDKMKSSK